MHPAGFSRAGQAAWLQPSSNTLALASDSRIFLCDVLMLTREQENEVTCNAQSRGVTSHSFDASVTAVASTQSTPVLAVGTEAGQVRSSSFK